MDKQPNRRDFLKASAAIASAMGIDPAAALENLMEKTPVQALGELAGLQHTLNSRWKTLDSNFFNFVTLPNAAPSLPASGKEHNQQALHFLATCGDDKKLHAVIADAYVRRYQVMHAIDTMQAEIDERQQAFLSGDNDLAVRLRKLSQAMGEEARRRFIEATQADTRPPIKIHTIEEKKEDKEADQSGWRETPITSASMAEKRWEKLAQFQQECPSYPTFDEVQEHLCKSYMPETFLPILEDIVKKQHNRIDRILADSTSMAGAKEETRRRISDHLHDKQFWLARINKIFIEDRIGLDDSFDWSLYRAVINASGSDKTQAEAINTKLTRQGQKQFQLRVLECVLQNNDLPAALKKSVENHIEFFKRRISYRPQKLQEIEEQEKAETKRSKKEKASEAEKHKGVLSEDTKTALDAMRRPGEFGAEHSWFEKLYQDRHNKDDSKKPTK